MGDQVKILESEREEMREKKARVIRVECEKTKAEIRGEDATRVEEDYEVKKSKDRANAILQRMHENIENAAN